DSGAVSGGDLSALTPAASAVPASPLTPASAPTPPARPAHPPLGAEATTSGGLAGMSDTAAMQAILPQGIPTRAAEPPAWREPDGVLAPLPPERFTLPPYWRVVAIGVLAALVISVGAGFFIAHLRSEVTPPTLLAPVSAHIQSSSVQVDTTSQAVILDRVPSLKNAAPTRQLTLSLALPTALETGNSSSGTNSNLPLLSPSQAITLGAGLPSLHSTTTAIQRKLGGGLGQQSVGATSIENTSIASDGATVMEAVDGVLLVETPAALGSVQKKVVNLATFFHLILSPGDTLGETQVVYDQATSNWILVANAVQFNGANGAKIQAGMFDVAISASGDATGLWYLFKFSSAQPALASCNWAEHPQIGLAGADLFISGVSYACGSLGQNRQRLGAAVWAMPLNVFASGGAAQIVLLSGFTNTQGQPALNLTPSVAGASDTTEWLMSDDADPTNPSAASNRIALWAIRGVSPAASATNSVGALSVLSGVFTLPLAYGDPGPAQQLHTGGLLNTGDSQITQLLWVNHHLYAALATGVNWTGEDTTRSAALWFEVTPTVYGPGAMSGATRPGLGLHLNQIDLIGAPGLYVFFPTLTVDARGNVALFAQYSGAKSDLGLLYAPHYARSPAANLAHPDYNASLSGSPVPFIGQYWGDTPNGVAMTKLSLASDTGLVWVVIPHITVVVVTPANGKTPAVTANEWQTEIWQIQL
ncbi:MAG TPA: hypothetical protein VKQ36_11775, partial [Ktedonobacterales bacterium]|nr:hypothetical protein [Ktedonobacterales bacterium]